MKDRNGLEIGPERPCPICGEPVATRPDGSVRAHARLRSALHPRLGLEACPGGAKPRTECPACSVEGVTYQREEEKFPYGIAPNTIELTVVVDVGRCIACAFQFTDWRAEIARDAAVQAHLQTKENR